MEPWIAVNPTNPNNLIGVWQQDRWSNGGARGLGGAYSLDGGGTWTRTSVPFSRCSGGNAATAATTSARPIRGSRSRPTAPRTRSRSRSTTRPNGDNAILVARSTDGGRTWSNPVTLKRDGAASFNDKEAITADPTDARYVYAVWDRLTGNNGPTWFARTVDGGATWEPARNIYDPDPNSQTINNQIVVLPDGVLVLFFTEIANVGAPNIRLRIMRSADKGATWSAPITIAANQSIGTVDPETGTGIRDGSILGSIAAGKDGTLAVAWQDARFAGSRDDIAFSRSTDGGLTWSAPAAHERWRNGARVPAGRRRSRRRRHRRRVLRACARTRPTRTRCRPLYMLATSSDGVTWTERQLAGPFDYATAALAGGRYFIGDYMGMTTIGTSFVPFFAQTTGDPSNRSDITAALARATTIAAVPLREGAPVKSTHDRGSDDRRIRATRGGERAPRAGGAAACRDPAGTIARPLTSLQTGARSARRGHKGQTLIVPDRESQGSDPCVRGEPIGRPKVAAPPGADVASRSKGSCVRLRHGVRPLSCRRESQGSDPCIRYTAVTLPVAMSYTPPTMSIFLPV